MSNHFGFSDDTVLENHNAFTSYSFIMIFSLLLRSPPLDIFRTTVENYW